MIGDQILFLTVGIVFLVVIIMSLFVYLAFQRGKQQRLQTQIDHYRTKHHNDWYLYLIEGEELGSTLIAKSKEEQLIVDHMLSHYAENISSDAVAARISLYAEQHLQHYYRDQLQSKHWAVRMNVLHKIVDFHMDFLADDIAVMLKRKKKYSNEEYLQMYIILSIYQSKYFLEYVLHPKFQLGEFEYKNILFNADAPLLDDLVLQFYQLPSLLKYVVVDFIGIKNAVEHISFLENLLTHEDPELKIRALKAIVHVGYIKDVTHYLPFIESDAWEERLMATKLLIHVPFSVSLPYLNELLKDSSWWVRSQAAKSLMGQRMGKEALESIVLSSDDSYAIDMAKEALGRG